MTEPKLLSDDELKSATSIEKYSFRRPQILEHIAAQSKEIERLRAVPETLQRYRQSGDEEPEYQIERHTEGEYVLFDDVVKGLMNNAELT